MNRNDIIFLIIGIAIALFIGGSYIVMIHEIYKQRKKLILNGLEDEAIKKEYTKEHSDAKKHWGYFGNAISVLLSILFIGIFAFSLSCQYGDNCFTFTENFTVKVVQSGSMSYKNEKNKYLFDNNLNDQIDTFDVVFVARMPDEFELQQYDIVLYEVENILVIHRIINIEEPNANHPNERWFQLQGDANGSPDKFPVKYSQMRGIYTGDKIPFVGAFILFLQSSLGYLVIAIILVYSIGTPIITKKINAISKQRLLEIGFFEKVEFVVDEKDAKKKLKKKQKENK